MDSNDNIERAQSNHYFIQKSPIHHDKLENLSRGHQPWKKLGKYNTGAETHHMVKNLKNFSLSMKSSSHSFKLNQFPSTWTGSDKNTSQPDPFNAFTLVYSSVSGFHRTGLRPKQQYSKYSQIENQWDQSSWQILLLLDNRNMIYNKSTST